MKNNVPNICDIVLYGDNKEDRYRVNGWLKRCKSGWRWCLKDEAEGVSLTGVRGALASLDEVTVVGRVAWSKELIASEVEVAISLGEEGRNVL